MLVGFGYHEAVFWSRNPWPGSSVRHENRWRNKILLCMLKSAVGKTMSNWRGFIVTMDPFQRESSVVPWLSRFVCAWPAVKQVASTQSYRRAIFQSGMLNENLNQV